jgi:hypothetical protein
MIQDPAVNDCYGEPLVPACLTTSTITARYWQRLPRDLDGWRKAGLEIEPAMPR